jgi:3-phenylpropionate/trans-cinnamate dioxygenase ferredoxin reductase component
MMDGMDTATQDPMVIVGGGLAAGTAAVTLRDEGYDGPLVVICREPHPPYERPPLSKGYLAGKDDRASFDVVPASWFDEHDVDLRLGTSVDRLDLAGRYVVADGEQIRYDRLLLATGATPRHLPMADAAGVEVTYLRTVEDSEALRSRLGPGRRVVLIGGGWIGLEVAATARTLGAEVTVVETAHLPLLTVLGEQVAAHFAEVHRGHGVDLRLDAEVVAIEAAAGHTVVRLADGSALEADDLVVGIGAVPDTALAETAGLEVDNGIVVDARLRTLDPHVWAAGDVALVDHPTLGPLRVEHWDNAKVQGAVAARAMLGRDVVHDAVPYFFTDQYDLGMEYFGHVGREGFDDLVIEGDLANTASSKFTVLWKREGRVRAGMHVNDWDAGDPLRAAVTAGIAGPE